MNCVIPPLIEIKMHNEGHPGFRYCNTSGYKKSSLVHVDRWNKIVLKWSYSNGTVQYYLRVNDDVPLESDFNVSNEIMSRVDNAVETQIFAGNDTPAVDWVRFYPLITGN